MRGKVAFRCDIIVSNGITPAYAGKSGSEELRFALYKDHPRVCGEKIQHPKYTTDKGGSPPRMRGKDSPACCSWPCIGITPAYAGKSSPKSRTSTTKKDHPRVCGEKPFLYLFDVRS